MIPQWTIPARGAADYWAVPDIGPVTEYPRFQYTMRDVRRAGEALAGDLIWTDESAESIRQVFRIANNYRDSHAFPMRKLRREITSEMRKSRLKGFTVARLKRMPSVRRKLRAISSHLNQIQDLAGCRAVLPSIDDVNSLIAAMRTNSRHVLHREDSYIIDPKADGYRSHHMVFKFQGTGDEAVYNDRRIELQIRTRLQHSWATAVEAVGLFEGEDMKAGQGSPEWLRLFKLMSVEFLVAEGCAENDDAGLDRRSEIIELNANLNAIQKLEDLRQAVKTTDSYVFDPNNKPDFFLIRYDRAQNSVSARALYGPIDAMRSYDSAENVDPSATNSGFNTVLVEVDEIENLKAAYPNYFGDVDLFKNKLQEVIGGEAAQYNLEPQPTAPQRAREKPDYSWLTGYRSWK
jgi:ppGpp synthetase/RelA/SpoT-type nucleotidyltranferase